MDEDYSATIARIASLSEPERINEIANIITGIDDVFDYRQDSARQQLMALVGYYGICPEEIMQVITKAGGFYTRMSQHLYYQASAAAREQLITQLGIEDDPYEIRDMLGCLAFIGDETTLKLMRQWQAGTLKPSFAAGKKFSAIDCTHPGGWELDVNGNRRNLVYEQCYLLERSDSIPISGPVRLCAPREDTCAHCGGRLVNAIVIDGHDKRLSFLGIHGVFSAPSCLDCALISRISYSSFDSNCSFAAPTSSPFFPFVGYVGDGTSYFAEAIYEETTTSTWALTTNPVSSLYPTEVWEYNSVGGYPAWVQDADYPKCTSCHKTMMYVAQFQWASVWQDASDTFFIFVCTTCNIGAVVFQGI